MWTPSREVTIDCLLAALTTGIHRYGIIDNKWPPFHRALGLSRGFTRIYIYNANMKPMKSEEENSGPATLPVARIDAVIETLERCINAPLAFRHPLLNSERDVKQLKKVITLLPAVEATARVGALPPFKWVVGPRQHLMQPVYTNDRRMQKPIFTHDSETPSSRLKVTLHVDLPVNHAGPSSSR